MSRNHVSFPLFDMLLSISATALRSGRKHRQSVAQSVCCRCNSHRQLVDRLAHRSIEIIQPLPVQSPVEDGADAGASQPKFDAIRPVDQLVLSAFQPTIRQQKTKRKFTLIVERMPLTEPKTVLALAGAGAIAEVSFARFKVQFDGRIQHRDGILAFRLLGPDFDS